MRGQFTPKQHLGFEAAAWYWHFVDVVWLFLFACIYVWGGGAHHRRHGRSTERAALIRSALSVRRIGSAETATAAWTRAFVRFCARDADRADRDTS